MDFTNCLQLFLKNCNAKNLSVNTIDGYRFNLKTFFDYCEKMGISDINKVNQYVVMDYFASMKNKYSPCTIKDKFIVLKAFITFLCNYGIMLVNPMENMKRPKIDKRIIYSFSKTDLQDIFSSFDKSDFIGFRNYTIMSVLFGTGMRKSELLGINIFDIDLTSGVIKVMGKGNKERIVPIGITLQKLIGKYIKARTNYLKEHKLGNNLKLFIGKNGEAFTISGLNTVFNTLKANKAVWSTRVSAHTFRHTFAKYFLLNGGDLFSLQKILGHEDISTVKVYVELNQNETKIQNEKFNPLDNNRWQYY